jgi:tetratricopeptide (TPR) repeat protein
MRAPFLILVLALATAAPAAAQPANSRALEEARTRFQTGVQLFHEGSLDAALAEFRKAYSLAPTYRVLYNIAQVQFELHNHVEALKTFRQYLQEGGAEVPPDRRAQVEAEIQKLERRVSLVEITTDVDGADILVDDVPIGVSPLRLPVMVNAGNRRVTAIKTGRVTTAQTLTIAGGDRVRVHLQLPEVAVARSVDQVVTQLPPPVVGPSRTKVWVSLATTAALGIGAGTMALLARQAKLDFDKQLKTFPNSKENIDKARDKMVLRAAITDGLAGAALLAGGLTLYFAVSSSSSSDEPESKRAQVRVLPTLGGLTVAGQF